jgi:hypothetical protein
MPPIAIQSPLVPLAGPWASAAARQLGERLARVRDDIRDPLVPEVRSRG